MKSSDQQFCTGRPWNIFGRSSPIRGRRQEKRLLTRRSVDCTVILAAFILATCGFLFGCGGGSHAAPAPPSAPPVLPSAASLPASCTAAATVGAYNCQIAVTGGQAPFTWTANKLPQGLKLTVSADTTTATISGTVQSQQATKTVSFTAPVTEASSTTTASVQLTVTSSTGQSASLSFSITLTISPLAITTTSRLAGATLGSAYTATVTAAGGLQPYTWGVATGSRLPAGLKLTSGSPSATVSGTPTATGTFQFTLNVSDAESTAMTASATFTLTVSTSSTVNCTGVNFSITLCGTYGLGVRAFNSSNGPNVTGVIFTADNSNHIVSGTEEVNDSITGPATNTITGGSYSIGADGRGDLTLISSTAVTRVFRFVLESTANPGVAQVEEFDSTGIVGSGVLLGPEMPPIGQIPASIILSLPMDGIDSMGRRNGLLGDFQIGPNGCDGTSGSFNSLGSQVVTNTAGAPNTGLMITGSCTPSDPNTGIGTAKMTISGGTGAPFTNATLNFVYVALGAPSKVAGAFFLETDPIAANQPILSGLAQAATTGGINAASIACTNANPVPACLFVGSGTTDGTITTGHGVGTIVRIVTSPGGGASGTLTGVEDQNAGGTIKTAAAWSYTSYTVDTNGVGTITGTGPIVHFIIAGDTLQTLDESPQVLIGTIRQQNATTIVSPGAAYIVGLGNGELIGLTPSTPNVVGVVTPSGTTTGTLFTGTLSGTVDISSSAGSVVGAAASGNYLIDTTTGRGTGTANLTGSPGKVKIIIYARRGRQFVVLDVQSTDPYLLGARLQ
jgi:hypothetical protein